MKDDLAMMHTEEAAVKEHQSFDRIEIAASPWKNSAQAGDTRFDVQQALFCAETSTHKLSIVVKVKNHLRSVERTQSMMSLSRSKQAVCNHRRTNCTSEQAQETLRSNIDWDVNACTFKEIFTQWVADRIKHSRGDPHVGLDISFIFKDMKKGTYHSHFRVAVSFSTITGNAAYPAR